MFKHINIGERAENGMPNILNVWENDGIFRIVTTLCRLVDKLKATKIMEYSIYKKWDK